MLGRLKRNFLSITGLTIELHTKALTRHDERFEQPDTSSIRRCPFAKSPNLLQFLRFLTLHFWNTTRQAPAVSLIYLSRRQAVVLGAKYVDENSPG